MFDTELGIRTPRRHVILMGGITLFAFIGGWNAGAWADEQKDMNFLSKPKEGDQQSKDVGEGDDKLTITATKDASIAVESKKGKKTKYNNQMVITYKGKNTEGCKWVQFFWTEALVKKEGDKDFTPKDGSIKLPKSAIKRLGGPLNEEQKLTTNDKDPTWQVDAKKSEPSYPGDTGAMSTTDEHFMIDEPQSSDSVESTIVKYKIRDMEDYKDLPPQIAGQEGVAEVRIVKHFQAYVICKCNVRASITWKATWEWKKGMPKYPDHPKYDITSIDGGVMDEKQKKEFEKQKKELKEKYGEEKIKELISYACPPPSKGYQPFSPLGGECVSYEKPGGYVTIYTIVTSMDGEHWCTYGPSPRRITYLTPFDKTTQKPVCYKTPKEAPPKEPPVVERPPVEKQPPVVHKPPEKKEPPVTIYYKVVEQLVEQGQTGNPVGGQLIRLATADKPGAPEEGQTRTAEQVQSGADKSPAQAVTGPDGQAVIEVGADDTDYYKLPKADETPKASDGKPTRSFSVQVAEPKTSGVVVDTTDKNDPDPKSIQPPNAKVVAVPFKVGAGSYVRLIFKTPYSKNAKPNDDFTPLYGKKAEIDWCKGIKPGAPLGSEDYSLSSLNHQLPEAFLKLNDAEPREIAP